MLLRTKHHLTLRMIIIHGEILMDFEAKSKFSWNNLPKAFFVKIKVICASSLNLRWLDNRILQQPLHLVANIKQGKCFTSKYVLHLLFTFCVAQLKIHLDLLIWFQIGLSLKSVARNCLCQKLQRHYVTIFSSTRHSNTHFWCFARNCSIFPST